MNTKAIQQAINIARVFEADMDLDGAAQMAQDELEEKDAEIAKLKDIIRKNLEYARDVEEYMDEIVLKSIAALGDYSGA